MRTLIVGAGATGGYYGARLTESGADVTFLVRPARAAKLAADGLNVRSPLGDLHIPNPPTVTADRLAEAGRFDLILLSCKAYDLDSAIADLSPAVGAKTAILPVLNGLAHLDALDARFGAERVLGGSCAIAATLAPDGTIRHMSELCSITYGERDGSRSARIEAVDALMRGLKFQPRLSESILLEMWEKWVFLATLAGATTLMRAAVGDIVAAPGGPELMAALHGECTAVASASGYVPRGMVAERARGQLTAAGSTFTASMLRDIENGGRIEADHVIGDLIARGRRLAPEAGFPLLTLVYTGLKAYEARRARETA
ncbi:2-dehydropantoate 2-reductase [Methylobacterium sp. SI9]|uniref:2-dehydropantoate 2-reductase n=1 Tax=Methylobacterium guangdongense TaxID=3138811 RepID=UPI00313CD0C3